MNNSFKILSVAILSTAFLACNSNANKDMASDSTATESMTTTQTEAKVIPGSYIDLNTGKTVYIIPDPQTGRAIDSISQTPIEFYIDNSSGDTLYQTGIVVNDVIMQSDGKWMLDETKIKRDGDEIKIKFENGDKIKMEDDEMKVKDADGKTKVDGDSIKVKSNQ